ncbi:hypothetical protein NQ314_012061, partial [Rhamnusium bicolor]
GIEKESSDKLKALEYIKSILNHLDMESGHNNKLKVQEILTIKKEAVAGEMWRIKAEVVLSECLKSESVDPQKCKTLKGSDSHVCIFRVWNRPWPSNSSEVKTICEDDSKSLKFRLKRNVGVPKYIIPRSSNVSTKDDEVSSKILEYVKIGLNYLDLKSIYETKYVVKKINEIIKQAGSGQVWQITAEIALSDCPKHYYTQYCEELEDNEIKKCIFKVWEQTWLSSGLQINITCENDTNIYLFEKRDVNNFDSKEILSKFKDFILEHNKTYLNKIEYNYRLKVFKNNLNTIKLLNKYEQGTGKYGITKFTDLTTDEFSRSHGLRMDLRNENDIPLLPAPIPNITLPIEFDWRQKGAVTQVKNQGSCGSCWAFSTTGNIEGQYAIKYGKLLEFSEQELVDCDKLDEGCNGGLMDNAYRTIEKMGGLETESDYPYDAEDEKCHFDKARVQVQLTGALNISHNETDMAKWLVQNGPISIAINANAMQFYIGGVSHPWKMLCNPKNLDHGVVIVGFGVHSMYFSNHAKEYEEFEDRYFRIFSVAEQTIRACQEAKQSKAASQVLPTAPSAPPGNNILNIKLPDINLPKFTAVQTADYKTEVNKAKWKAKDQYINKSSNKQKAAWKIINNNRCNNMQSVKSNNLTPADYYTWLYRGYLVKF